MAEEIVLFEFHLYAQSRQCIASVMFSPLCEFYFFSLDFRFIFLSMRIVSMVPSWTETLIAANVNIVGKTRFCIHPKTEIPVVGGTKDWDWSKIVSLKPDLLILDKEENPVMMSEQKEIPYLATHVSSIEQMPHELLRLSNVIKNLSLAVYANEWQQVISNNSRRTWQPGLDLPGIIDWGRKPEVSIDKIIYIIWKSPWMCVSSDTFIGSMLNFCGLYLQLYDQKYPQIDLENMSDKKSTLLLFSSEPYPFLKKQDRLAELGFPYAFVNGESFSWFGVRSLHFLKNLK